MEGVGPPKLPKAPLPKAISRKHIRAMLGVAQTPRELAILLLVRDTGCRIGETLSLTWKDVSIGEGKATVVGKGDKMLIICLRSPTCQAMSAYQEMVAHGPDDPICWGKKGPLTYRGMYHLFKRLAEKAGISDAIFNPHTWRHAFGRDTTIAGIPTAQLQDLMVHSTMEVTKAYARFNTAELQEAHAPYSPVEEDLKEIQLELQHKNQATSSHTSHDS